MSVAFKLDNYFTYADYCKWDDGERWELIDGIPYAMASPRMIHQIISGRLFKKIDDHLDGKKYQVLYAPFDVRLNHEQNDDTVVQPDLLVVCDESRIGENSVNGVPDMIIEILSPSTARYDKTIKLEAYRKAHVGEFWYVDPDIGLIEVITLIDGIYHHKYYGADDKIAVLTLPGLEIDLNDIFGG